MNYEETLQYLFKKLPMFSRIGAAAIKPDLTNTVALCNFLNNPQQHFKCIHVAGTNGKGSVSHMLASVFQTAGYKTGLYTSPHLKDFRERVKVNGEMISREFVTDFTQKIIPVIETIEPSFFEITVALAFDYFADQGVEIAVIETGLGGRLDSTNILIPEISVITNIGWDHMNLLGDSLEKIAFEKAGIIKHQVPVVIGETRSSTAPVFEKKAKEEQAPLFVATAQREAMNWQWLHHQLIVEVSSKHHTDHKRYQLDLPGIYQIKNLLTVLETITQLQLRGWKLEEDSVQKGLQQVRKLTGLHGRWEVIQHSPMVVLDVAHNAGGVEQLLEQIELTDHYQLHIILGMVKDKEIEKVLALFPPTATYYFTQAAIPRALEAAVLQAKAALAGLSGDIFSNVNQALQAARLRAGTKDLIIICGSVFLVGEVN